MNILLVEDNEFARRNLTKYLMQGDDSLTFFESETGEGAIKIAKNVDIDFAIVDLHLPDMNGVDVIEKLYEIADIDTIITTAAVSKLELTRAVATGINGIFIKPINPEEILALIKRH